MIKRVRIFGRRNAVWSKGSVYEALPTVRREILEERLLFDKEYPKGTPTREIWSEIRESMINYFFDIFYPAVVFQTHLSDEFIPNWKPRVTPVGAKFVSRHLDKRLSEMPENYVWNSTLRKWHMSREAYIRRTGRIDISVSWSPYEEMFDYSLLDEIQEELKGKTIRLILMVYPDRYDEEIRSLFTIEVTFW